MQTKVITKDKYLGWKFGEILISLGKIEQDELESILITQKNTGVRLGEFLLKRNIITEDDILQILSLQLGIEKNDDILKNYNLIAPQTNLSRRYIKRNNVIIFKEDDKTVEIAINDPFNFEVIENIKTFTKKDVKIFLAKKLDILRLADIITGEENESADKVIEDLKESDDNIQILDESLEKDKDVLDLANEAPIIKLVNLMITEALRERASDIHIEPSEEGIIVRYRIDGVLYNVLSPPKQYQQAIVSRIKIMSNLNIAENRLPQDGRIMVKYGTNDVDIRISIIPSVVGERIVMRLLVKDEKRFNLSKLGMDSKFLKDFKEILKIPHGLIIISGPTGCGKTTTLYAAIKEINTSDKNIITIEDPVEYRIKGISQIQVNPKINLTFANGLRSIMRQDPEVILIGEIRDRETAQIAIQAAMTGHLVLSTIHTTDAASGIVRLLDIGIEPYLISSTVIAFISQRLIRVLCPSCKKIDNTDLEILSNDEIVDPKIFDDKTIFRQEGCSKCHNTGFHDRLGIFEMIRIDDNVRKMIIEKKHALYIRDACKKTGMKTIIDNGIKKVLAGLTPINEVLRVIRE